VNYIRQYEIDRGIPAAQSYNHTMWLMAGLLLVGLLCNLAVKPVHSRHHLEAVAETGEFVSAQQTRPERSARASSILAAAWTFVGGPLAWGVFSTLQRALALFRR
jgi:hypothetical protein